MKVLPLHSFDEAMTFAQDRIRSVKHSQLVGERESFARGVVTGYVLAGAITLHQENDALKRIDRLAQQRVAILQLEEQARAEGLS
ncbi:MAG TPA: hypothetical protein VFJ01_05485 [Oleiagrimonas sp.]|nr:hypothetical protein [Oleiagrimonas sp.]